MLIIQKVIYICSQSNTNNMKNSDEPAFAAVAMSGHDNYCQYGLTKRELFAAMAMQGLCSDPKMTDIKIIVQQSAFIADLLLEELEKSNTEQK